MSLHNVGVHNFLACVELTNFLCFSYISQSLFSHQFTKARYVGFALYLSLLWFFALPGEGQIFQAVYPHYVP